MSDEELLIEIRRRYQILKEVAGERLRREQVRNIADILIDDGLRNPLRNWPREKYHAIQRMSASVLKAGLIGSTEIDPTAIKSAFEGTRSAPSAELQDSFDRGTLCHTILLEPETLVDSVAVWKGNVRHGHEWTEFEAANRGKLIMRERDVRGVMQTCRAIRGVRQVNELLRRQHDTELVVFGKHGKTFLRSRLDFVSTDSGPRIIVDIKTDSHGPLDEESCLRTCRRLHYREQLGLYSYLYREATGIEVEQVFLLFVSLSTSAVRLVRLTTSALQFGLARMTAAIEAVERCIESNEWPDVFFGESLCDVAEFELGPGVTFDGEDV